MLLKHSSIHVRIVTRDGGIFLLPSSNILITVVHSVNFCTRFVPEISSKIHQENWNIVKYCHSSLHFSHYNYFLLSKAVMVWPVGRLLLVQTPIFSKVVSYGGVERLIDKKNISSFGRTSKSLERISLSFEQIKASFERISLSFEQIKDSFG